TTSAFISSTSLEFSTFASHAGSVLGFGVDADANADANDLGSHEYGEHKLCPRVASIHRQRQRLRLRQPLLRISGECRNTGALHCSPLIPVLYGRFRKNVESTLISCDSTFGSSGFRSPRSEIKI